MKRSLFFIFCIMFFSHSNITTIEENHEHIVINEKGERSFTLYALCFIMKEFLSHSLEIIFFIDQQKMTDAKIACCKCNYTMTASNLWAHFLVRINKPLLDTIMSHVYDGTIEDLVSFTLKTCREHQIQCDNCFEYNDWYIPEQLPSKN